VILEPDLGTPIGCCDVRPDAKLFRGEIGLSIGEGLARPRDRFARDR
jgi:hypothetical protein